MCLGAQPPCSGRPRWEDAHPQVAEALQQQAEAHAHQDPTFRTLLAYTRLTAKGALEGLRAQGYRDDQLPAPLDDGCGTQSPGLSPAQSDQS